MFNFIKDKHLAKENVIGHTEADGKIVYFVTEKKADRMLDKNDVIPKRILWRKTDVVEVGTVEASREKDDVQVQAYDSPFVGTLGMVVQGSYAGPLALSYGLKEKFKDLLQLRSDFLVQNYVLTNMHVASDDLENPEGPRHYGQPNAFFLANKSFQFVRGIPQLDCALLSSCSKRGDEWIGQNIRSYTVDDVQVGEEVRKFGAKTGSTESICVGKNATMRVNFGQAGIRTMRNLDIFQNTQSTFSQKGDSGSVIYRQKGTTAVSLLFAASDTFTFGVPLNRVFSALRLHKEIEEMIV